MRFEKHNLDGRGERRVSVYDMTNSESYWAAVTDVPCPICTTGTIRWAEAGYVPGYRICDKCHRHFLAGNTRDTPTLIRVTR